MAWANSEGKITRVRAVRPERLKPFREVGDLGTSAAVDENSVRWNLRAPNGSNYRLIAQGRNQQANSVYMFALE
ncbi:MAG: hypothetical protein ABR589_05695 [Chthoniobacterales bacterium]